MKYRNNLLNAALIMAAAATFTSCGGESGSSSDSKFFGNVPRIYSEMLAKKEAMKEQYRTCESQDEYMKLEANAEKAEKEYTAKLEEAGKALDGTTIEIQSTPEIIVNSPITLTFDGFQSKSDMTPRFKLAGNVVAAQNYQSKDCKSISTAGGDLSRYTGLAEHVFLRGYDEAGAEVFSSKVAIFPIGLMSKTELGVKAETPLQFESFTITKKNVEGILKTVTLKLGYAPEK